MLSLLFTLAVAAPPADSLADVLERSRRALGTERLAALPHGLRLDGTLETGRARTEVALVFDGERRFAHHVLGEGAASFGYDGESAWLEAADGGAGELDADDAVRLLATTWFLTGQWLLEPRPVTLALVDETDDAWTLAFEMPLGRRLEGEVDVARGTGFPRAFRWDDGDVRIEHELLGFRDADGVRFPRSVRKSEAGVRASRWTFLAGSPAAAGALDRATTSRGATARFDRSASPRLEVKRLRTGHLLVKPRLDGEDVGWFLFDSGASGTLLSANDADRLGLERFGRTTVHGIAGSFEGRFARGETLRLGPLVLDRPLFTVVDMSAVVRGFGHPLSGLIGFDVLAPCVAEIDVDRAEVALHEPSRAPFVDVEWTPISLPGRHAVVAARIEGRPARLVVDTGSDGALTLQPSFSRESGLLDGRATRPGRLTGASRRVPVRVGAIDPLVLAGRRFADVATTFLDEDGGGAASESADGILGLPVLSGLRLVLDYPRRRLALLDR